MAKEEVSQGLAHPRQQHQLFGHDAVLQQVLATFQSGRIPHAWLLTGPKGIGKATLAYRMARSILSNRMDCLEIDAEDPIARRIMLGSHADLLVVETAEDSSVINVEQAREVGQFLRLMPSESDYRVVIIDSVDDMNVNAANAILKLLEEPPKNTVLLLVSHAPGRLLPTIRSRCRQLALAPLDHTAFTQVMQQVAPEISQSELEQLALIADYSVGRAAQLHALEGVELYKTLLSILQAFPQFNTVSLHAFAEQVASKSNPELWPTATYLLQWFLLRLIRYQGNPTDISEAVAGEQQLMAKCLEQSSLDKWFEVWEKTAELVQQTDRLNLDKKQTMINLINSFKVAA